LSRESLLLAAWAAWLGRVSGRMEAPLLVYTEGRDYPELEGGLGPFGRRLPLSAALAARTSSREAAIGIEAALRDARRWQEYLAPQAESGRSAGWGFDWLAAGEAIVHGGVS